MNQTIEPALLAEARKLMGRTTANPPGSLRVIALAVANGQEEVGVLVSEDELRQAFKAAGQTPTASYTLVTHLGLCEAVKRLGLTALHDALWSMTEGRTLFKVEKGGKAWMPGVTARPFRQEGAQASAVDARAIDEAFKLFGKERKVKK